MQQKECRECGILFPQFRTTETLCHDCTYKKHKARAPKNVKKRIIEHGKHTVQWLEIDRPKWFANHPPSHEGYYECYLQISPKCLRFMVPKQTTLDHVKARSSNPSKRHKQQNFKPACYWCNQLKGSMSLTKVRQKYPKKPFSGTPMPNII